MESTAPYVISPTDQRGLIVIVETMFMSWMIFVGLIRLYMRIAINGPVQMDDFIVFTGSIVAIAHVGTIMRAVSHGLGRTQDQVLLADLEHAGRGLYASNLLFVVGHGAAKISVCLLLKRLGRTKDYLLYSKILLGMVTVWTLASFLAVALSCLPQDQLTTTQKCSNLDTAWKAITAFDVITDILTFGLSAFLVWGVQMRWREKGTVIFAFGTRIPLIIVIVLRQTYLNRSSLNTDPSLHLSKPIITTAVLLHTSLMIATVPCLKPFVVSFNTGWGQGVTNSKGQNSYFTPTGKSASTSQSRAYASHNAEEDEVDLTVARPSQESRQSQQMIIHQTREWIVEEEYEMHSVKDRL
ncbi:uncharacterized protein N7459_002062 [Penicillium hispanicum]|uniref:uncharacterized protein n=1 Tax=Penicillium hispanicum TaxID=1080232 RepID=UPI00254057C5|nr:uncharacterized protein N7459_002062 [Penicillium hispanicum]KAJ5591693.1 hypothetical protein N7459_002062 [Penicillium hispanicum]